MNGFVQELNASQNLEGPREEVCTGTEKSTYQEGCESQHGTHIFVQTRLLYCQKRHLQERLFFPQTTFLCDFFFAYLMVFCFRKLEEKVNEVELSALVAPILCFTRQHLSKSPLQNAHLHAWVW